MKVALYILITLLIYSQTNAQSEGLINNGNAKIYYRTFGKGTPVLIINGGPGMNSDGFVELAKKLSGNHQTIIYDQRGTGRSLLQAVNENTISMDEMVQDIEVLRKHLKISQWTVFGHSFGGMLASYYATIHPANISALILSSSGGIDLELRESAGSTILNKLTKEEQEAVNYWQAKIDAGDTSYAVKLERGMALAPAYVYDRKHIPIIAERLTQSKMNINNLVWQDLQKIKFNCAEKLAGFTKPVLIIQGKQDVVEEKIALKAKKVLKNSTLLFIDRCVHYGWLDRPDVYYPAVEKFLDAVKE